MADGERVRFGPEKIALAPVLIVLIGALPLAATARWLNVVLLVPVACAVWVLRAKVVVTPAGVQVCNGLGTQRFAWPAVDGFDVPPRGPVRLLSGERRVALTALPRRQVRELVAAAERVSGVTRSTSG